MVFGEVFVRVASGVGQLLGGSLGFVARQLTAVGDRYFFIGLVAGLGGQVLNFADKRFAVEDFAEDNVLAV